MRKACPRHAAKQEQIMKTHWCIIRAFCAIAVCSTGNANIFAQATTESTTLATKPLVQEPIHPAHVTRRSDGVFFIDFGRAAFGYLELQLPAPLADKVGRKITIRLGEKLTDSNHIDPKPGGSVRFLEKSIITKAAQTTYRPALTKNDARLMPKSVGPVMPFRYAELENLPESTTPDQLSRAVHQITVHYPFDDSAADFACSDPKVNAIWDLCKYSMKATSFAGLMVDGDRERKPYEADLYINQLGWQYCCRRQHAAPAHA